MPRLILMLALSTLFGTAALAADGKPDINQVYQTHSNCHIAYDLLTEEVAAGKRPSDEEINWANSYEAKTLEAGAYCPPPPDQLRARATDHVISTKTGLDRTMAYAGKQDDPVATFEAGFAFFLGKFGEESRADGYQLVGMAADWGDPIAQFSKAVWLSTGKIGGKRDNATALPLLEAAGEAGHLDAMFNAGLFHMNGLGTAKDPKKSFYWFRKAAEAGHLYAAIMAFDQINSGTGVKQDFDLAYRLSRNIAQAGSSYGMVMAASSLLQGKDPYAHQDEILYWLDQANIHGDATIRAQAQKARSAVIADFDRHNAPPQYVPKRRKACPMQKVCLVDRFSGAQSCTTHKDYWSDCDY